MRAFLSTANVSATLEMIATIRIAIVPEQVVCFEVNFRRGDEDFGLRQTGNLIEAIRGYRTVTSTSFDVGPAPHPFLARTRT